jgi:hypothetical protein
MVPNMFAKHTKMAAIFPEQYDGKVKKPGNWDKEVTVVEAAAMLELPPILKRIGDWVITIQGIHSIITDFQIEKERLDALDWAEHMKKKDWVNHSDFIEIWRCAKYMYEHDII